MAFGVASHRRFQDGQVQEALYKTRRRTLIQCLERGKWNAWNFSGDKNKYKITLVNDDDDDDDLEQFCMVLKQLIISFSSTFKIVNFTRKVKYVYHVMSHNLAKKGRKEAWKGKEKDMNHLEKYW